MSFPISIKEVPFFRLITPFLAGIACQYWLVIFPFSWWTYSIILFILVAVLACFFLAAIWRFRWSFGLTISLFLFFYGASLTVKPPVSDKLQVNNSNRAIIYLLDNPQLRSRSIRVEAEVRFLRSNNSWWGANEKMLVYFDVRDTLASALSYGSVLAVNIIPQPVPQLGNPFQFDYRKYLSDRGVSYTAFLKSGSWIKTGSNGVWIKEKAFSLRDKLVLMFKANGLSGDELAVASALTLGYKDLLDDELRHVYSSSGAMHILAVSGLHVGILYVLLSFFLSFLNKKVLTRAIKALLLLGFLWFFALLTGLQPSVQRSALMFSFLVVGDFFNRKSDIYNTLAASAFILLVVDPYNLQDIGFQLSYLAVTSIIFFYPYIYRLVYVKNWIIDKLWSLAAVSIAAQFGTFSICLFYFNQFPNYFLLTNLIAIPLSTIALYLSVFLIIVSPFSVIAGYVGKCFSFTVSMLNHGLEYIEKLPYSVSEGLHISALQMFVIICVVLAVSFYLITKRNRYILATLLLIIVFLGLNLESCIKKANTNEFIVFNISKKSLISFRSGNSLVFVDLDTSKNQFNEKYEYYVKGYISSVGVVKNYEILNPLANEIIRIHGTPIKVQNQFGISAYSFMNRSIVIPYNQSLDKILCPKKLAVDFLVINRYSPCRVFDFFKPKVVIIDSSVSKHTLADVTQLCKQGGMPYYITSAQGAFVLKEFNN